MNITIEPVGKDKKEILRNLLEKYQYEFSQYDNKDTNDLGLYGYDWLDCYWTEENRWAYFIRVNNQLAGFMMINDYQETPLLDTDYAMAEFFVMYKFRRMGAGKYAAKYAFDKYKGKWQLKRHPKNRGSVYFWNKIIEEYTNGKYELMKNNENAKYEDSTNADIFIFET
ncbi:MAG: GNAT family N-acetyltransferase [Spirochaetaceae bacterium]|jgi:predicted acetyltransferase|nr:GNAT family N-acetyltransferase [Spirochaetaceae bacterium]